MAHPDPAATDAGPAPAGRILLLRFGSLGDVVLTFAAGAALRSARPGAHLTYLVKQEYADLVSAQPWVDEVWPLPAGEARGRRGTAALRARVRAAGFASLVDWQTSPRSRALTAGHPHVHRWRADRWQRRRWVSLRWTRPAPLRPAWRRYGDALGAFGVAADVMEAPRLAWPAGAAARAAAFLGDADTSQAGPLVACAPGARWFTKRWPEASWLELCAALRARGRRVVLLGDGPDRAALPGLSALAASPASGVRWFHGSLLEVAALLGHATAVVANDTGLLHLAAAAGRPVVALFGSTHPALGFAPAGEGHAVLCAGLDCQPCTLHGLDACPRGHHRCMRELAPAAVLEALEARLGGFPGHLPG